MEELIMPFIFGMLAMIGIAAIVTLVAGTFRVIRHGKSIDQLWTSYDQHSSAVYNTIYSNKEELLRNINEQVRELQSTIERMHESLESSLTREVDELNRQVDVMNEGIDTHSESLQTEIDDAIETMQDDLLQMQSSLGAEISLIKDEMEENARNSQSYLDSRLDKLEAKLTNPTEKSVEKTATKKVLKG